MARGSRRTPFTGSAFIRSLAALNDVPASLPKADFAEALGQWFSWTDAIALSSALNGAAAALPSATESDPHADELEYHRLRQALVAALEDKPAAPVSRAGPHRALTPPEAAPDTDSADFSPHRQRYLARQRAMAAGIEPVRQRMRATLSGVSPAMAQLAALDALMEQVVGAKARTLLSTLPFSLERHFERLRRAAQVTPETAPLRHPAPWQDQFRRDMRQLLLAELDFRLQPLEGLLAALRRSSSPDAPAP
jgi:hypothetical protein